MLARGPISMNVSKKAPKMGFTTKQFFPQRSLNSSDVPLLLLLLLRLAFISLRPSPALRASN